VLPGFNLDAIELHRAPERAKWLRPIGWRYLAYGADEQVFVTTAGWISRRTSIVLHHKTQSVRLTQGPLQQRLGLADVHIDTPLGPTNAVALHRSAEEAAWLTQAQADQARRARQALESIHPDQS
jgi:putative membrane protein